MRIFVLGLLIFMTMVGFAACGETDIKEPVVAGSFYPSDPKILSDMIDAFLKDAEAEDIDGKIIGIIAPHAGYIYSGGVAAYGFKTLKGKFYKRVIVIAPCHHVSFDGISVWEKGVFRTPLGDIPVDEDFTSRLIHSHEKIFFYKPAYSKEHSLEVELPFLQKVLKGFKIVPIIMGRPSYSGCEILAESLVNLLKDDPNFLIVASTDMSHYHPYYEARSIDRHTIDVMEKFDPKALFDAMACGESELCGIGPTVSSMLVARQLGADKLKILKYANSGDTVGDKSRVVGYASAVFYKSKTTSEPKAQKSQQEDEDMLLNEKQKERLIKIARQSMETFITKGEHLQIKEDDPVLNKNMGAFVTLHQKGKLRGCIGNIIGSGPLYQTVIEMAVQSSTSDPRFTSVGAHELDEIDIEISVLSELEKTEDPNDIEMGKHGVVIRKDFRSGVFLPQVAAETGWSREEFLSNLCAHKAGLSPDAWKKGECEIYVFTAEVFGEK